MKPHWIDRLTAPIAPRWTLQRVRARVIADIMQRHYDAAAAGRRTQGWRKSGGDVNALIGPVVRTIREHARELVRNNPYAESALATLADHVVGTGIVAKPKKKNPKAQAAWDAWAGTKACDADGRNDFYGLQALVQRTMEESGEVLIRRRIRRLEDNLPLPIQLQVLDPDFIDTMKDTQIGAPTLNGHRIIQGVEFDAIGRRVAYWLFPEHPGAVGASGLQSVPVPAESILHCFEGKRPGQVHGLSAFAPVTLRFHDFDEFEDATLMKQKIAACLAVLTSDVDGTAAPLGTVEDGSLTPQIDSLEPGAILNIAPGRNVEVVQPPQTRDYEAYSKTVLRAIATGLGVTYEDLTGDYQDMPFSAARMSRLRHWARIDRKRWKVLIPQFCDPVWVWAMEAATIMGQVTTPDLPQAQWTAPPPPLVDPVNEGLAFQRLIRSGLQSWSESVRERGYDPETVLTEIAADLKKFDDLGIVLDIDVRRTSQSGQAQNWDTGGDNQEEDDDTGAADTTAALAAASA